MRQVLADAGFVEGRNLTIEYRFAEGKYGGWRLWRRNLCADRPP